MWSRIAEFFQDNAPFGVLLSLAGIFGLNNRMNRVERGVARNEGVSDTMAKQVDWLFKKMGGNGDSL